jgi:hypothetical protein
MDDDVYHWGAVLTGGIVFIGSWIYCIAEYGFLFGVGLGWLPSIIVAVIAGALWPLIALGIAVIVFFALKK